MTTAYNFHCDNPLLAAQIASLRTADIQDIFKACFSVTVNIMQKFPKPPKCKAAEYIVDNAPGSLLRNHLAQHLAEYQRIANGGAGRPVNKYRHDPNHNNDAWRNNNNTNSTQAVAARAAAETTVQVEVVPDNAIREVQQIIEDANSAVNTDTDAADNLAKALADLLASGNMLDENKVREIARQEDSKVAEHIQRTISEAVAAVAMPTRVVIDYQQDGGTVTRDLGLQHKDFPTLLKLAQVRGPDGYVYPVWLPGPAGSGKTTAAKNVAKALNIPFHHNGAIDTEYKLLGFTDAGGNYHETPFYKAYKDGGVYLFDEVDASAPQALVAMNAAMENGHCTFGNGECVPRHEQCIIIAAANTFGMGATHEYVGRNKLDAATVDRFIMLAWEYDEALERAIAQHDEWVNTVQKIRKAVKDMGIKHVVSPRASFRGADMLRAGLPEDYVMQAVVYKGLSADQVNTIKARIR